MSTRAHSVTCSSDDTVVSRSSRDEWFAQGTITLRADLERAERTIAELGISKRCAERSSNRFVNARKFTNIHPVARSKIEKALSDANAAAYNERNT